MFRPGRTCFTSWPLIRRVSRAVDVTLAVVWGIALAGCSSDVPGGGTAGAGGTIGSPEGGGIVGITGGPATGVGGNGNAGGVGPPPTDFTKAEVGGYKLGRAITGAGVTDTGVNAQGNCGIIVGVVRDFKGFNEAGGHPDFEHFQGDFPTKGLVGTSLGTDAKPVYTSQCESPSASAACPYKRQTTDKAQFDQWYRFTDGVNKPYLVYFAFAMSSGNVITFNSQYFFPLDGSGWGGTPALGNDGLPHDFGFTTELHMKFKYDGGEIFKFEGDDDLWVFINGRLAIDLGGLHPAASGSVDLDGAAGMLGIAKGGTYSLELFHAERHTTALHFRIDTTLSFVDCGAIPPDVH